MRIADIWSGIGLCVFALLVLFVVIPWQIEEAPAGYVSPRLVPQLMMGCVALLSLIQVIGAWNRHSENETPPISRAELLALLKIAGVFALAIALYFAGTPLGAGIAVIAGGLIVLGERRIGLIAALTAGLLLAVWYLFYHVLGTAIV